MPYILSKWKGTQSHAQQLHYTLSTLPHVSDIFFPAALLRAGGGGGDLVAHVGAGGVQRDAGQLGDGDEAGAETTQAAQPGQAAKGGDEQQRQRRPQRRRDHPRELAHRQQPCGFPYRTHIEPKALS